MQSIVLNAPGQLRRRETEEPLLPGPGEVLIRIQRIGVCGTDFHAFLGEQPFFSYPRILGHELGVEVVALGEQVETLAPGMRCAVEPYFSCGTCSACRRGKPNCCLNLKVFGVHIDGGMREYAIIPAKYLHPAKTLSFDQLALVEPLSIGAHAVSRAQITSGEQVLVIGAGPIGLAVTQFALLMDANVSVNLGSPFANNSGPRLLASSTRAIHSIFSPPTIYRAWSLMPLAINNLCREPSNLWARVANLSSSASSRAT
jgi:threonine dehydrogenase-like Zn-dependent dehydrogenase